LEDELNNLKNEYLNSQNNINILKNENDCYINNIEELQKIFTTILESEEKILS